MFKRWCEWGISPQLTSKWTATVLWLPHEVSEVVQYREGASAGAVQKLKDLRSTINILEYIYISCAAAQIDGIRIRIPCMKTIAREKANSFFHCEFHQ